MVQGLAFLSKKSWHTKNFANQEKVWMAEERQRAEEQKTKELAKQIQQEREEQELEEITGQKRKLDKGIDWMYQGINPHSEIAQEDANKQSEEFLLGKAFVPTAQAPKGDLDAENKSEGLYAVLAAKAPADNEDSKPIAKEPTVHDRNEAFRMRHEDPMFAVSVKAREKQENYEHKKALYERVVGGVAVAIDDRNNDRKKRSGEEINKNRNDEEDEIHPSRKEAKKVRRHRKHKRRGSSDDERSHRRHRKKHQSRSRDERGCRSRSRNHDDSQDSCSSSVSTDSHRDRHGRRRKNDPGESRQQRSTDSDFRRDLRKRSRSRERSPDDPIRRERNVSHLDRGYDDDRRNNERTRDSFEFRRGRNDPTNSFDLPKRESKRGREESPSHSRQGKDRCSDKHRRDYDVGDRRPHTSSCEQRNSGLDSTNTADSSKVDGKKPPTSSASSHKIEGYGLQGRSTSTLSAKDLGPSQDLLEQKRREREESRRRLQESAGSRRHITAEERASALRAMEEDARRREEIRRRHVATSNSHGDDEKPARASASFIRDVHRATHGVDGGH